MRSYAHFNPPSANTRKSPLLPTTATTPAVPCYSHTCQGSSRESLIIATDGSPLWGLLVYVTSYVGSCKFTSARCCSLSTPAVLLHVWLLVMGKTPPAAHRQVPQDVLFASGVASLPTAVSEYDGDGFYGTLNSPFTWGWMTVFTAHKWSGVHISGDMLKRRCAPLSLGCLLL